MSIRSSDSESLYNLLDRQNVIDRVTLYAFYLDRQDLTGFRGCFTDKLEIDFSDFNGRPATVVPADEFIAFDKELLSGITTQHLIANHVATINKPKATLVADAFASHHRSHPTPADYDIHGVYHMELMQIDNDWKISSVQLRRLWTEGDRSVLG